jgi:hypothetical protein
MAKKTRTRSDADLFGEPESKPARPPGNSRGPLRGSGAGGRPANPERDALYREQTRLTQIKADKLAGLLIERDEAQRVWEAAMIEFRQTIGALPARGAEACGFTRAQVAWLEKQQAAALRALAAAGDLPYAGKH